jgi:hypothetical protein
MMTKTLIAAVLVALTACASKPQPPAWEGDARSSLDGFTDDFLRGDTRAADAEFARARRASASTGRFDVVAQAELVRCGVKAAALDYDCAGFAAIAGDATPAQRAYAAYLDGRWQGLDAGLLPEQHRAVVASGSLAGVADPLSRLVAAGALLKAGRITPTDIAAAVDAASSQGWRRPLLAWLGVQEQRARAAGDAAAVEHIRRRIQLTEQ